MELWHPLARLGVRAVGSGAITLGFAAAVAAVSGTFSPAGDGSGAAVGDEEEILFVSRRAVAKYGIRQHPTLFRALRVFSQHCELAEDAEKAKAQLLRLVFCVGQLLHQSAVLHNAGGLQDVLVVQTNLALLNVKIDRSQMRLQKLLIPTVGREKVKQSAARIGQFVANFLAREQTIAAEMRSRFMREPAALRATDAHARKAAAKHIVDAAQLVTAEGIQEALGDREVAPLRQALQGVLAMVEARRERAAAADITEVEMQGGSLKLHSLLTRVVRWFAKLHASQRGGLTAAARGRLHTKLHTSLQRLERELTHATGERLPLFRHLQETLTTFRDPTDTSRPA